MITILSFIVVIGIIVFVHELGHFLAAKLSGVRVEVFSLGFPPRMLSRKIGETEYQLSWIPLGGYVKMSGMSDESFDSDFDRDDPRGFTAQPFVRKIFIIIAGVIMNILLGFAIYSAVTWQAGVGELVGTMITMVSPDYPAADVGLEVGDVIVEVAGEPVDDWGELTSVIRRHAGVPITVGWQRGDSLLTADITPRPTPEFNLSAGRTDTVGKIGVVGSFVTRSVGPLKALEYGAIQVWWVLKLSAQSLAALIGGQAHIRELTGPIGIAKLSGETARSGLANFLTFIALISVSIAFLNILPIPMLDGGHLLFILIEAAVRRPIPENVKINLMKIGMAALLLLILVVSYHDVIRFFIPQ